MKERDHSEDLGIDNKKIFEKIFGSQLGSCGMDACSCCEHGTEPPSSIKGE